jgi:signal transduction histidine kinase/CheY-like chemotaxis protein
MKLLTTMFIGLLLTCVLLLGILALGLAAKVRHQLRAFADLDEELKRSREESEQQKSRLAEQADLDRTKSEFISTVSHELRTPLTSIRGALGLLSSGLMGDIDSKAQNLLRIASTNAERLIRLINDILDLERMESGRAQANLRRCSLFDLAHEAVDSMTGMAEAVHIRLSLHCFAASDAIYFDADPDRILQVMTNLLSNAIKFSPPASMVSVQINANNESLFLKVVDRGRGIPEDKLESIFNRFQQVESADSSKKGGTGLGLAICRSIISQHGGTIWAQPNKEEGKESPGTTFCVQLSRCARASDTALPSVIAPLSEHCEGLILVCDDDAGIRTVVSEQLRQNGYEVIEASSGEEVIALAHEQAMRNAPVPPISGILLDLYLPGLSGWETLQQLKNSKTTAAIPVVILSVVAPTERLLRAGEAQGWVQKPFSESLLLAELGRVLQGRGTSGGVSQSELRASRLTV